MAGQDIGHLVRTSGSHYQMRGFMPAYHTGTYHPDRYQGYKKAVQGLNEVGTLSKRAFVEILDQIPLNM